MKKIIILVFFFATTFYAQEAKVETKATAILKRLKNPSKDYILAVSHRGDWRYAPENSLAAIQRCIDLGVDVVEIDVRLTKDRHMILMHDKTVDRTTNGKGKVSDFTLAEIKKLRLKNACGVKGSIHQIPTLKEVMELAKDKILINLDKVEGETVKEAYAVLKETGTIKQAIFKGRKPAKYMLDKYGDLMKEIIYMPILIDNVTDANKYVEEYNNTISPFAYEVTFPSTSSNNFKQIKYLNSKNITVLTIPLWDDLTAGHTDEKVITEGADAVWGWLINNGANAIMTDRTAMLMDYLRSKNLHD
ncbi:glycerophosphodiester phosphodiesterase family protein [Polaribacter batillariae]|uniref:Glycerophosphodiester phosphodiesterase family protein n=1 Tax=Polaribacter batillariae TaxID=2808900 RepID=A0ABX7SXH0_9FLAO|nr:glycerophosphodiester phosphodiesterase family protein [Polaribacter batillariae]QTD38577.1 glycerophosphodiester phosphodiesterase family protein [Polaribacter batillariae]